MLLAAAATTKGSLAGTLSTIVPMLFVLAIFWALVIRPQQQRDKAHREMLGKLKKGDKVVLAGGIHGEIVELKEDVLTVKISEKVDIRANRSAVSQVKTS